MQIMPEGAGWLEVICGPMFSGKSEELIRRLRRAEIARLPLQVFKPCIDDRYDAQRVASHSAITFAAETCHTAEEIARAVRRTTRVVGIDEVQFFDDDVVDLVERLANAGVRVIVAGLDQDYLGRPFEPIPRLMALAEYVTKTLAICTQCGAPAVRSQRLVGGAGKVQVGAAEAYEARCRRCHSTRSSVVNEPLFDGVVSAE